MSELYHFCSLESFFNIFNAENPVLRLVNSYRMNDYFENKWLFKVIKDVISEIGETEVSKKYKKEQENLEILFKVLFASYITSFSCTDIKLPLWREYASNGKGVAIVFNFEKLSAYVNN